MDAVGGLIDGYISAPSEGLKRIIRDIIPAEDVNTWLKDVDQLDLPVGHLDRLFNELGGPTKVAELTGRKTRQVQRKDPMTGRTKISYEKRKLSNADEKEAFLSGDKFVAKILCNLI